ncbi:hypothetical protein, partial [Mesomycoplasma hyopneumoniae]|uniref:hypothetical protein n=1 Tax=Mesomycoplasma hyopneumoniae TaxID=2099 RepID=UPI001E3B0DF1
VLSVSFSLKAKIFAKKPMVSSLFNWSTLILELPAQYPEGEYKLKDLLICSISGFERIIPLNGDKL